MCAIVPLVISATYMGLYWGLFAQASEYDDMIGPGGSFDGCGIGGGLTLVNGVPVFVTLDTKWTTIFTLNAIVYTLLTAITIGGILSAAFGPLAFCSACGFCCVQFAHVAAIVVAGVYRYIDDGPKCAAN